MPTNDTLPQAIKDGDNWFLGFASRLDPSNIPEKMLQASSNMRLQRGTATIRKGAKRLNGYLTDTRFQQVNSTSVYTDPDTGEDFILMVLATGFVLCYQDGTIYKYVDFTYSNNVNPSTAAYPVINLGDEVQAIQALDKVYILRGMATTPAASVTFTNADINNGSWGTFTVSGFPFRKWISLPYTVNLLQNSITISIPRDHGFNVNDLLQVYSPVSFSTKITAITNTTIVVNYNSLLPSTPGNISFMLYNDLYNTEFIVQSTSEQHFNGTYPVQNPATILSTGQVTFQYFNDTGGTVHAHTNQNGMTLLQAKSPIVWDGTSTTASPVNQTNVMTGTTANVPPADFGIYFQNRLILKTSPHYIAVSDILSDTFDMQLNNFNINLGSGGNIVGVLPWIENQFLVFMNKAIYLAFVETTTYIVGSSPGANSSITLVTNEVGCLARRSIVNAGQFVFFLSPKGVHMLTPQLDLKLLGNTRPLSEPIADFFDALNYGAVQYSSAAYYNNRFYISIPWNGSAYNNRVAVYNTLNEQWESIDSYQSDMYVDEFFTCSYGNERRLMAGCRIWSGWWDADAADIARSPGVALLEEVSSFDQWSYFYNGSNYIIQSSPITGVMRTREYTFDSLNEKRFTRAQIQTNNSPGDQIQVYTNVHDPDTREMIMDYTFSANPDATLRPRIASRGACVDIEIAIVAGTPSIKTVEVSGISTDRQMISQE